MSKHIKSCNDPGYTCKVCAAILKGRKPFRIVMNDFGAQKEFHAV